MSCNTYPGRAGIEHRSSFEKFCGSQLSVHFVKKSAENSDTPALVWDGNLNVFFFFYYEYIIVFHMMY